MIYFSSVVWDSFRLVFVHSDDFSISVSRTCILSKVSFCF